MAITKIHPIKSTLKKAIDYITDKNKTEEMILVSAYKCHEDTAHEQFLHTRNNKNIKGSVLARHLIQSFLPGETTPELAHEIGMKLCNEILKGDYEFVLSTHVDKGHIHNHILFNNVSVTKGKCYQSNKRTYHKIRSVSDKLCEENGLVVIDEYYRKYKAKFTNMGHSYAEYDARKKGTSWKSRLAFDIDRCIKKAMNWEEFLALMEALEYEIKQGKYIAFRHKDKERFTRSKTLGEDYIEEKIRERIASEKKRNQIPISSTKAIKKVIDTTNNDKYKEHKAYEMWVRKHNVSAITDTILEMKKMGITTKAELEKRIEKAYEDRQNILTKIKEIEKRQSMLDTAIEDVNTVLKYKIIANYLNKNPNDKDFNREYEKEIKLYNNSLKKLKKNFNKLPDTKALYDERMSLEKELKPLIDGLKEADELSKKLYNLNKNFDTYEVKGLER